MTTSLVTGATGGIGAAVARRLHARGDRVVLLGRDAERLTALAAELDGALTLVADLGHPEQLAAVLADRLPDALDVLVHSAGAVELGPVAETGPEVWRALLAVNLAGPAELTRLTLPTLRASAGHIVFINSGAGLRADVGWGAYAASKFGLRALADSLRAEEAGNDVRVTSIYPGRTATAMQEKVHALEGKGYDPLAWIHPDSVAASVMAAVELSRDAEITDLTVRPGR